MPNFKIETLSTDTRKPAERKTYIRSGETLADVLRTFESATRHAPILVVGITVDSSTVCPICGARIVLDENRRFYCPADEIYV